MTDVTDGHGGKRPGAGRPEGSPNKVTIELGEAAREYTPLALKTLADICENGTSEQSRIAAATALLDRGYGKPKQIVDSMSVRVSTVAQSYESPPSTLEWLQSIIAEGERKDESRRRNALPPPRPPEEESGA